MKIIGYEKEKQALNELKEMLLRTKEYFEKGVRIPKGVILSGEPGIGKTKLAKEISEGLNLIELKAVDIVDEDNISAVSEAFSKAKENAPSILLIDEIDKLAGSKKFYLPDDNDKVHKVLLQELDSVKPTDGILVIATCNERMMLSEALQRPGRFDRIIELHLPDFDTRKQILEEYFNGLKYEKEFSMDEVAKLTGGDSGADIERLVNEVGIYAVSNNLKKITLEDIRFCMNKISFNGFEGNLKEKEVIRNVAIHEAGHALVGYLIDPNGFYGATIIPQGNSNGHMMFVNKEKTLYSKKEIENSILVAISGHVSEKIFIGEYQTGSSSDLRTCMAKIEGMARDGMYGYQMYVESINSRLEKSDKLNRFISEQLYILDSEAEKILTSHKDEFLELVDALVSEKIVSKDRMDQIMSKKSIKSVA